MLLAAASTLPEWAVKLGLVRFTGQDIDQTCVRMASINCMLYGLNGYGACLTRSAAESVALGVHPKVEYTTYSNGPLFRRDKFEL